MFVSPFGATNKGNSSSQARRLGRAIRNFRLLMGQNGIVTRTHRLSGKGSEVRLRGINTMATSRLQDLKVDLRFQYKGLMRNGLARRSFVI